jgi:Tfp pilus assembly protein PilX
MKNELKINNSYYKKQCGAALVTVLMVTVLLGIACIALLSSVGANSRNSTDVLSETKAYYAAESGLQATINVLRNQSVKYSQATSSVNLSTSNLSGGVGLAYNCSGKVAVGSTDCNVAETFYDIVVDDPDDSGNALTFSTGAGFSSANVTPYVVGNSNNYTFTYTNNAANCQITFVPSYTTCDSRTNPRLGTINVTMNGNGSNLPNTGVSFSIQYGITAPRGGSTPISGVITQGTGSNSNQITVKLNSNVVSTLGSSVTLCSSATDTSTTSCPTASTITFPTASLTSGQTASIDIYMKTTPVEPYRLKVLSTGYGPNKAKKQLEAVIQANLLNDESAPSAFTLQGPVSSTSFQPGTSGAFAILGEDGVISQPSIGVINQSSLEYVNASVTNPNNNPATTISPPPAIVTAIPTWLSTPQNLDAFVSSLRQAALNSNPPRYYNTSNQPTSYGDNATGTGITFCDGNCTAPGNTSGGGILVVTGTFTTNGAFNFRGLILITGPGGFIRSGNGGGVIRGSIVLAPYDSASLAANVFSLPPTYNSSGSGNSVVDNDAVSISQAFNGTNALTDLMLGIAEK